MNRSFLLLLIFLIFQQHRISPEMNALADTERAFATMCVESGIRTSFLRYFSDDGIAFQPHPIVYRQHARQRPAPMDPKAVTLEWKPIFGDVAESGDLGYTTGPYVLEDNSPDPHPQSHGFYFSVWKKEQNGSWKVALDIGIRTTSPYEGSTEFVQATTFRRKPEHNGIVPEELTRAEQRFSETASADGIVTAASLFFLDESRLHRNGHEPMVGKNTIMRAFSNDSLVYDFETQFARTSHSGELGYAYGRYKKRVKERLVEKGYYARVWKKDERDRWKIAADITSPIPEDPKTK